MTSNNKYIASIRTGTDTWCYIITDDLNYLKQSVIDSVVISKLKWSDDYIKIISEDIPQVEIEQLKKQALKLCEKYNKK